MSVATINTLRDAASAAVASGDYTSARQYAMQAQVLIATTPDVQRGSRNDGEALKWRGEEIAEFLRHLNRLAAASSVATNGLAGTKLTYARPSS